MSFSPLDPLWVFFILSSLQPVLRQRWLEAQRVRAFRRLGLPVSTDLPLEVSELVQLDPQTAQRRPSVEYIPLPHGPRERDRGGRPPARDAGDARR